VKILVATGGTGGHVYPAIALAKELRKRNCEVLFAVRSDGLAARVLDRENFQFAGVLSAPMAVSSPRRILEGAISNLRGLFQSMKIVKKFSPDRAVGFGAYASVPPVVAAFLLRVPIILHEQNISPGRANRFCSIFARNVAVSFPETEKFFPAKSIVVGNPVRDDLFGLHPGQSRKALGLEEDRLTILVFGGSAGAKSINLWISRSLGDLADLNDKIQFVHLTGHADETEKLKASYSRHGFGAAVMDYSHRMNDCYASASLAVCRSGASTVAELIATRTPAILVPYPHAAGGHQMKNALFLESLGSALTLTESENLEIRLAQKIREIALSNDLSAKMRENYGRYPVSIRESAKNLADAVIGDSG
jgi:UDP-N-acetylglucosamine--N-acetylmuramyl-(pentapeptide) pyrophosphoryl-undecaprenol N-acetylglucosamine transferase